MANNTLPRQVRIEMNTVGVMIKMVCADLHGNRTLCTECLGLLNYAERRLRLCPFGDKKPTCLRCTVHCYRNDMKERIRTVMRHAGPRMLLRHPWLAIHHLWKEHRPTSRNIKPH